MSVLTNQFHLVDGDAFSQVFPDAATDVFATYFINQGRVDYGNPNPVRIQLLTARNRMCRMFPISQLSFELKKNV